MKQNILSKTCFLILFVIGCSLSASPTQTRHLRGEALVPIEAGPNPADIGANLETYGIIFLTSLGSLLAGLFWQNKAPQYRLSLVQFSQMALIISGSIMGAIAFLLNNIQAIRVLSLSSDWVFDA